MLSSTLLDNILHKVELDDFDYVDVAEPDIDLVQVKAVDLDFDFAKGMFLERKRFRDYLRESGAESLLFEISDRYDGHPFVYYLKVERDGTGVVFSLITKIIRYTTDDGKLIPFSSFDMLAKYLEQNVIA
jgi:hypothetical protein